MSYLAYWGKAQPTEGREPQWHPLAYHALDVAAVGAALLEARPQLLTALVHASGLQPDVARRWFLFALALHDLGKFACCFQTKVEKHFARRGEWKSQEPVFDPGHGVTGLALWAGGCDAAGMRFDEFTRLFGDGEAALDARGRFDRWIAAACGHHGRPVPEGESVSLGGRICPAALEDARVFTGDCAELFDPRIPPDWQAPKEGAFIQSSWLVAGLAMLCDWVGSNEPWFPYTEPTWSLAQYWGHIRDKARDALRNAGLTAPPVVACFSIGDALPGLKREEIRELLHSSNA